MRRHDTSNHHKNALHTSRGKRAVLSLGAVVAGLLLGIVAVNATLAAPLTGVMYPGVSIAGHTMAWKTRAQVATELSRLDDRHTLTITLGEKTYNLSSDQLGATRDTQATIAAAYQVGRATPWPLIGIFSSVQKGRTGFAYRLDTSKLSAFASKITTDIGRPPVNAKIDYVNGELVAIGDQKGVAINQEQLAHMLEQALSQGKDTSVSLTPSEVEADVRLSDTTPVLTQAKAVANLPISLTYNDKKFAPSSSTVASWLVFPATKNASGQLVLGMDVDVAKVKGYVQSVANEIDIAPTNKKITIKNGVSSTDQEGQDGLATNQDEAANALTTAIKQNQALAFNLTTRPVAYKTQYNRVTTLDVGRYIEVNLSSQHLWVYQDNQVIYESPITSGATGMGFPTVTGLFSIYSKATNVWLDGRAYGEAYNYRVLVDYWMPFYAGFGLHDAWRWRTSFGGADYYYNGSHGCVNLPLATAQFLYNWAEIGTPVWVHV